jgi:hypothetical protein
VTGKGRYLGVNLGVVADRENYGTSWWGEGEVKVFLDGESSPTLSGTGTEDYIGTGWGQGQYSGRYQGCHFADPKGMRFCFYRLHVPDPVWFRRGARVTIQQIGYAGKEQLEALHRSGKPVYRAGAGRVEMAKDATGLFERQDDWSACVYFYLDKPENGLPAIAPAEARYQGLQ